MQEIKDKVLKYWFVISALIIACMYFVFKRKNRNLQELLDNVKRDIILNKLDKIEEKTQKSTKDYYEAFEDYYNLSRRHSDILIKYGLHSNTNPSRDDH